ncbi:MAG: electron transfer flavoprotein subunit beta/FixA family protein [candidate division WOR-3 bacterium]|nr:electron transfer flavoprotein subunit beta/FixA family protein [candidate division WOR-3 bacterium]
MIKIIVCVKQVPDPEHAKMDVEEGTVIREGVELMVNPFDLYAVEEALRIKEELGGEVIVLSMGPLQAEEALKEAIAMGADGGILLTSLDFAGADTWATSYTLARACEKIHNFDLILCGKQAIDGDTAQVGPGIAAQLGIPQITFVRKINGITDKKIKAERLVEGGFEVISSSLPLLLTVVKEINEPRLPTLKGKLKSKKVEIQKWGPEDIKADPDKIGLKGSPTRVEEIFTPKLTKKGKTFTAEEIEKAIDEIIKKQEEMGLI